MKLARLFAADDRGTTLVEFALVAPVLILTLVACLDFARAMNAYVTIENASREGARYAAVHPTSDPAAIQAAVAARVVPLDTAQLNGRVHVFYDAGRGVQPWPTGGIPRSVPGPAPVVVRVDVSYPWNAATWLVGSFFAASGSRTFASSSSMEAIQ